jgi:hypothetical protein
MRITGAEAERELLAQMPQGLYIWTMKLLLSLPESLRSQRESMGRCLDFSNPVDVLWMAFSRKIGGVAQVLSTMRARIAKT